MTWRVLLDSNGLKVSRPGVDVNSAVGANLLFNPNYTANPVFIHGVTSTSSFGTWTVGFGKTFPAIPLSFYRIIDASGYQIMFDINLWGSASLGGGADLITSTTGFTWSVYSGFGQLTLPVTLYYTILDF